MNRKTVNSKNAPKAIGPYSQAVKMDGLVFTSGQLPIDPATNEFINAKIEMQTEIVLKNLKAVLEESGASLEAVLSTTVYLTDMKDFPAMNSVYEKFFPKDAPARTTVEVRALPKGSKIEINAVAMVL